MVSPIHQNLRYHTDNVFFKAPFQKALLKSLLKVIADKSLRHSSALRKGHIGRTGSVYSCIIHGCIDNTHLGAITVSDDDFMSLRHQIRNDFRRKAYLADLLLGRISQSISPQCNHNAFLPLFHYKPP